MLRLVLPPALTIAVDVVAWGVFHAAHRLRRAPPGRATGSAATAGCCGRGASRPAAAGTGAGCGSTAGRTRLPEAGGLFRGGVSKRAAAGVRRRRPAAVRPRDAPRRARPLVGDVLRTPLRAVEPAARGRAARRLRRGGQPAVHRDPALQPVPDRGPARASVPVTGREHGPRARRRRPRRRRAPARRADGSRHGPIAQLLIAWSPLSMILLAYAAAQWISAPLGPRGHGAATNRLGFGVHVTGPAGADRGVFGAVPSVWLQARLVDGSAHWYDAAAALVYVTHFVSFPLLTGVVWFCLRDRFAAVGRRRPRVHDAGCGRCTASTRPPRRGWPPSAGAIGPVDRISSRGLGLPAPRLRSGG